jgi:LysM repeat protein
MSVVCDFASPAVSGQTCDTFASGWGMSLHDFTTYNPTVACPTTLVSGKDYCIIGHIEAITSSTSPPATVTVTTSTTTPPTTLTTTTITTSAPTPTTPQPQQPGVVANCNKWHKVVSGDTCAVVESEYGIIDSDFRKWNPYVNSGK